MVIGLLIYLIILATAVPAGYFLNWLCDDELKKGRNWFLLIVFASLLLILLIVFFYRSFSLIMSFLYLVILGLIAWHGGANK
jgi:hypothetical protein